MKKPSTVLVTGGCGFIGSNFIPYFLDKYPFYTVVNLDLLTYAANQENLKEVHNHPRYRFFQGDIQDVSLVKSLFEKFQIQYVIHFAAESHVDRSIDDSSSFIGTNINGTHALLEVARRFWLKAPFQLRTQYTSCRFHHISTDEVFGSLGPEGYFTENSPYKPNNPYSASKASADMIVRSYYKTYGLPIIITNCSNNYGPKQHDEKLIPTIIRHYLDRKPIPIYGAGNNIRDWLYVIDHCKGIDVAFHKGQLGHSYLIGGRNEKTNLEMVRSICRLVDSFDPEKRFSFQESTHIQFVPDRPGHDTRYSIDASKMEKDLLWRSETSFEKGLMATIKWYLQKYSKWSSFHGEL